MKIHYTKELIDKCIPIFKQGIKYIYSYSKKNTPLKKHLLKTFQENLEKIPKWNSMIVMKEYDRFKINSNCSWLDKLIKVSFLAEFKIASNNSDIKVDIPKSQDFIHICYVELAREVWSKPQIMYDGLSNEIRKVYEIELDTIIESIIMKVIKNLLPLEKIVNNYLKSVEEENYNSDDDDKKSVNYDELQINNSDDDSSDDDYEDETYNSESMTHIFNEDVNKLKIDDVMINKIGGDDSSQKVVNTIDNANEKTVDNTRENDDNDDNDDDNDNNNDDNDNDNDDNEHVHLSFEDPLVPENIENTIPVIQDISEHTENIYNDNDDDDDDNDDDDNDNDNEHVHVDLSFEDPLVPENIENTIPVIQDISEHTENIYNEEVPIKEPINIVHEKVTDVLNTVDDVTPNNKAITHISNEEKITSTPNVEKYDMDDNPITTKIVKLGHDELEANNNNKIKNILGIDMNYNDFIKKKHRLRKSLLSKATA